MHVCSLLASLSLQEVLTMEVASINMKEELNNDGIYRVWIYFVGTSFLLNFFSNILVGWIRVINWLKQFTGTH